MSELLNRKRINELGVKHADASGAQAVMEFVIAERLPGLVPSQERHDPVGFEASVLAGFAEDVQAFRSRFDQAKGWWQECLDGRSMTGRGDDAGEVETGFISLDLTRQTDERVTLTFDFVGVHRAVDHRHIGAAAVTVERELIDDQAVAFVGVQEFELLAKSLAYCPFGQSFHGFPPRGVVGNAAGGCPD